MAVERFVVLGLGTARTPWFNEVARWATVGSIPVEFVKCISAEEVRVRLTGGRPFSAVLVDAATGAVDRDLLDLASRQGASVLVVDGNPGAVWVELGAAAVLAPELGRDELLRALGDHCAMIGTATDLGLDPLGSDPPVGAARGSLIAVTGSGGAGASSVAMALAQGLAATPGTGSVVLADLCLDAELAMLHDARDVVPGLQELVEIHRSYQPRPAEVQALTYDVVGRGYRLLLGLRRHRDWSVLKPRTFGAALDGLLSAFDIVVADVEDDLEGEPECGSVEVEERNVMARTVLAAADTVVVVGLPGLKGTHALVRTINRLGDHGVPGRRVLAVLNRSTRSVRGRAEAARTLADLCRDRGGGAVAGTLHLPERRGLDELHRDGARLPQAMASPLASAVAAHLEHNADSEPRTATVAPVAVVPGRVGTWADEEVAG